MESEHDPQVTPDEPGSREPDEESGPAVEPIQGDQGEPVEHNPQSARSSTGFNPDAPVATSPPPASAQSGVPPLEGGGNEGVAPQEQYRGPVDPAQGEASHAEANETDGDDPDDDDERL